VRWHHVLLLRLSAKPSQSSNQVQRNKRWCDTVVYQSVGNTTIAGGELQYVINPQATAGADAEAAWTTLGGATGGVTGFLVYRYGVGQLGLADFATGQFVSVFPVEPRSGPDPGAGRWRDR
jgi:hypothetical protein